MKRILLSISAIMFVGTSMAQWWTYNSLINGGGNVFGTSSSYNAPINIFTNGIFRAQFTTGNALSSYSGNAGDGLRIRNTGFFPSGGNLDLFTSFNNGGNETHAVFGFNGQVSGQNNRFEVMSTNSQGLYLNTLSSSGWTKFARFNIVQGFLGTNNFWRIGEQQQNQNLNAQRRLHVVDNAIQFRLSYSGPSSNGSTFTDFLSNSSGNLQIMPTGNRVGINLNSNPTANLDVNGNARIRNVQAASPNSILVGVNANGSSDVNVRRLDFNGNANTFLSGNGTFQPLPTNPPANNVFAINGLTKVYFFGAQIIQLGQSVGQLGNPGLLLNNREIPMNNYNLYFSNNDLLNKNHVGIGYIGGSLLPAKLSVFQTHPATVNQSTTSVSGMNNDVANTINLRYIGVYGRADGVQVPGYRIWNIGGSFSSESADVNVGVYADARAGSMTNSNNMGGSFGAAFGTVCTGLVAQGTTALQRSVGVTGIGTSPLNASQLENIGGQFIGSFNANNNYGVKGVGNGGVTAIGVYGTANGASSVNWAGYFDGDVYISGWYGPSDQNLKENIVPIEHADSLLNLLNPVNFDFKVNTYPQLNLQNGTQMGLIAQQAETVLPNIVEENTTPAQYDSLGNILYPSMTFKTIDYTKLIPLLISGYQSQAAKIIAKDSIIDTLQSQVQDLNNRLTQLENCLSGILPFLCQLSNNAIQATTPAAQEEVRKNLNVILNNREAIILDQNVPNPFAEQTVINFTIPTSVQKAQIHFYDGMGKLLQSVEITERGQGSITVFGADLSSGIYTYNLVADGQIVATKKMMRE